MGTLKVIMDPEARMRFIEQLLALDGLSSVMEDENAAYCPISLTNTPDELKGFVQKRQQILMEQVLEPAGITAYDPASAPFSPDKNLTSQPNEIYAVDSGKIVGARYFVGHNILPSTGQGIELEKAKNYIRIPVILMDEHIRVSRMQPHRVIYLQYGNFEEQAPQFNKVFELIQQYDPGIGFDENVPVLLGFEKKGSSIVNLEKIVYEAFPSLAYRYDGKAPILKLKAENPELFYEFKK